MSCLSTEMFIHVSFHLPITDCHGTYRNFISLRLLVFHPTCLAGSEITSGRQTVWSYTLSFLTSQPKNKPFQWKSKVPHILLSAFEILLDLLFSDPKQKHAFLFLAWIFTCLGSNIPPIISPFQAVIYICLCSWIAAYQSFISSSFPK